MTAEVAESAEVRRVWVREEGTASCGKVIDYGHHDSTELAQ